MWKNINFGVKEKIQQLESSMEDVEEVMEDKQLPVKPVAREPGMVKQRIQLFDGAGNPSAQDTRSTEENQSALPSEACDQPRRKSVDTGELTFVHRNANKKRVKRKNAQRLKQSESILSDTSSAASEDTPQKDDKKSSFTSFLYKTIKPPELPFDPADITSENSETEVDSTIDKTKPLANSEIGNSPLTISKNQEDNTVEENLLKSKAHIRQLSKEELLQNFHRLEELRSTYIKQIEEVIKCDCPDGKVIGDRAYLPKISRENPTHDITVYREEFSGNDPLDEELGISSLPEGEQNYVVEAYNKDGSELVISDLKIDHQSSYVPSSALSLHQQIKRHISQKSNTSTISFDEENATILEDIQLNQEYSCEDNEDSSVYMSLSDCMSGLSLQSNKGYEYFGEVPMRIKQKDEQSPNLKIKIGVEVFHENNQYKSRRETLFDRDSNPRIEKVSLLPGSVSTKSPTEKKEYIVEEIIQTEAVYISNLEKVVKEYIPYLTNGDRSIERLLFSNIRAIYEQSQEFFSALKQCDYDHEKIAKTFIHFKDLFELYPTYSMRKSLCDRRFLQYRPLAKRKQEELGDRLDLASYLLTPVQRLGKYILFLQNITKELNKSGVHSVNVQTALDIVKRAMKRGDDLIAINSIKCSPVNLARVAGSFVMRQTFQMLKPKKYLSTVFLFDEVVVFTINNQKEKEEFLYDDSIKMEDLTITTFEGEPHIFHLKNFPECKKGNAAQYTYILEAKQQKVKELWAHTIEERLWQQLSRFKEQASKRFRNPSSSSNNSSERSSFRKAEQAAGPKKEKARRRSTFYI